MTSKSGEVHYVHTTKGNIMKTEKESPHEHNLSLIERRYVFHITFVLKRTIGKNDNLKIWNKEALKHCFQVCSNAIHSDHKILAKDWIGISSCESQKQTGLQHFHIVCGSFWNSDMWWNNSQVKMRCEDDEHFRCRLAHHRLTIAEVLENALKASLFKPKQLPGSFKIQSNGANVQFYQVSSKKGNWLKYMVKEDDTLFWSSKAQSLIKAVNEIESSTELIPHDMLDLKWSKSKTDSDFEIKLKNLLDKKGGDQNE
jgi:hypothetical protein